MSDKRDRVLDPLGVIAIANLILQQGVMECSCEAKPVPCSCEAVCSCQLKCVTVCSCELKPVEFDLLAMLSNPAFREIVKGLDVNNVKTIEDFLSIVDDIRAKLEASQHSTPPKDVK